MPTARLLDDIATDLDLKQLWDLTEHIASLLNKALNMCLRRIGFVLDHHDVFSIGYSDKRCGSSACLRNGRLQLPAVRSAKANGLDSQSAIRPD